MRNKKIYENADMEYRAEILDLLKKCNSADKIRNDIERYHTYDVASVFEDLTYDELEQLRNIIGNEKMAEILSYCEDIGEYLTKIPSSDAANIIELMESDDALDILELLNQPRRTELFSLINDQDVKEDIMLLSSYDDDEFGSIMSTNFITVLHDTSIKGAMNTLVSEAAENDNIYTIFVTDDNGAFYGAIDLKALIVARSDFELDTLIQKNFPYVYDKEKISDGLDRLKGYSEELIPVLSFEKRKILGVITSQDIVELIEEKTGDDYAKFAAISSENSERETIFKSIKKRIPWLVILLFLGLSVSAVVGLFDRIAGSLPILVAFQSLILGMAGNVGTQSLSVTVRKLGNDEAIKAKKQLGFIFRETRIAFMNGIMLAAVSFITVFLYLQLTHYEFVFSLSVAGCVAAAMCFSMTIAGFTGAAIPIFLHSIKIDPAVASGPLITTVNDLMAVVSYYGLAWTLLLNYIKLN